MTSSHTRAPGTGRRSLIGIVGIFCAVAAPCQAGFIAVPNESSDENILLNLGDTGTTIPGATQSGVAVLFSSSQTLESLASGQATVGAIDGGSSQIPIDDTISVAVVDSGFYFSEISFNVSQSGQPKGVDGVFEVVVYPVDSNGTPMPPVTVTEDINMDPLTISSGQNRYAIRGVGGMFISSIDITPLGGASYPSLVQVRVGVVPEPVGVGICLSGLACSTLGRRRGL